MAIDSKLLERLEEVARERGVDLNTAIAHAVGICPTCGQDIVRERKREPPSVHAVIPRPEPARAVQPPTIEEPPASAAPLFRDGSQKKRARIVEWMAEHDNGEEYGLNERCAKALGVSRTYVSMTWNEHLRATGQAKRSRRGRPVALGAKTQAIIEYLRKDQTRGAQGKAAKKFKVTRAWVSAVWVGYQKRLKEGKTPRGEAAA